MAIDPQNIEMWHSSEKVEARPRPEVAAAAIKVQELVDALMERGLNVTLGIDKELPAWLSWMPGMKFHLEIPKK